MKKRPGEILIVPPTLSRARRIYPGSRRRVFPRRRGMDGFDPRPTPRTLPTKGRPNRSPLGWWRHGSVVSRATASPPARPGRGKDL